MHLLAFFVLCPDLFLPLRSPEDAPRLIASFLCLGKSFPLRSPGVSAPHSFGFVPFPDLSLLLQSLAHECLSLDTFLLYLDSSLPLLSPEGSTPRLGCVLSVSWQPPPPPDVVSEGKCPLLARFLSTDNEWQQTTTTNDMVNVCFPGALPLTHTPTHCVDGFLPTFRPPIDPLMCRSTYHSRISKWTPCIVCAPIFRPTHLSPSNSAPISQRSPRRHDG